MKELKFSKTKLNLWTLRPNGKYKLVKIPMKYKQDYLDTFSLLTVHDYYVVIQWLKELRKNKL